MKVFLTGATGILGRQIVRLLISQGFEVTALDRGINLERRKKVPFSDKINWLDGDLGDLLMMQKGMEDADFAIHAAALVSFDPSDRDLLIKTNVEGTANFVNCALKAPVLKKIVYISSVAAISPSKPMPAEVDERQGFNPDEETSDYAFSKSMAELEICRGVEEGLKAAMVNPSIILAPGQPDESSASLINYARKGGVFYPTGWLNYVDVRDVSKIVVWLLQNGPDKGERLILNSGTLPYQEFLSRAASIFKTKAPYLKSGKLLTALAWRLDTLFSFLFFKKPFLTKYTARSSAKRLIYRSINLPEFWPDFRFIPLEESLHWLNTAKE